MILVDITKVIAQSYRTQRGIKDNTFGRELTVLQAAVNYYSTEEYLLNAPKLWEPKEKPWLTRSQAALLIPAAETYIKMGLIWRSLFDFNFIPEPESQLC